MVKKAITSVLASSATIALLAMPFASATAAQPTTLTAAPATVSVGQLGAIALPAGSGPKCFLGICIPGGVVKVASSTKTLVKISDGIDGKGKPYGNKRDLRSGQSSKIYFYDTDMVYIPDSYYNAGYRLQVYRSLSGGRTVYWQTLTKKQSQGYKLGNGTTLTVRTIKVK